MYKFVILGLTFSLSSIYADTFKPYIESDIFLQSQPIDLVGTTDQWKQGSYTGGKYQYGNILLESGVEKNNLKIAGFYRREYQASFNPDTADYYYGSQHNQLDSNRQYNIDLKLTSYAAKGLKVEKQLKFNQNIDWSVGASIFQASNLQQGSLVGKTVTNDSGKDQTYNAHLNYYYDQDQLLDRPSVNSPSGLGYSLNTKLNWQPNQKIMAAMQVNDLASQIYWKNVPYTNADLSSADGNKIIGDDGFVKIKPAVSGFEGYKTSFKQTVKPKINAVVKFSNNQDQAIFLKAKHLPNNNFYGIGAEIPRGTGKLSTTLWTEKVVQVEYVGKKTSVGVGLDHLNPNKINAIWLTLGWHK